ncbi:MAG TPA: winged helix-turn-helix transcriptional regulator [Anaerolineae bacterium]|nr:winged helix-turn-helix transcriptional regulator [Anaerolineae bacterium]
MNYDWELTAEPINFARILADETRQEIMRLCCSRWLSVREIADSLRVTQPTVSHHLAVLRQAHLVLVRRQGRQTFYQLNQERVALGCEKLMALFAPDFSSNEE